MSNVKISQLPSATTLTANADVLPIVHDNVTQKATPDQIVKKVLESPGAIGGTTPSTGDFTDITTENITATNITAENITATNTVDFLGAITVNATGTYLRTPRIWDSAQDNWYRITPSNLTADRYITLPALGGNDVFVFQDHTQTLTNKTLTTPFLTDPKIYEPSGGGTNYYEIVAGSLAANRVIYLPSLSSNDTFVFEAENQTLTHKTISGSSNTLLNIANASLTNSSITINGTAVSLGGAITISTGTGTVTSVSGTGTVSGLTLSGTVTSSGSLTLGGSLNLSSPPAIGGTTPAAGTFTNLTTTGNVNLDGFITVDPGVAAYLTNPRINDASSDNWYRITPSELSTSVYITLPALSTNDTFTFNNFAQTLTNKTLTTPKIVSGGSINDANNNEYVIFNSVASAINEITITNASSANAPSISATGADTDVSLYLYSKGAGVVVADDFFSAARIKSISTSAGVGYGTGAGASVVQTGSNTSPVTINNICGTVTTYSSTYSALSFVSFIVYNSTVSVTDTVIVNMSSEKEDKYIINAIGVQNGYFTIQTFTPAAIAVAESIIINFSVIKSVAS